VQSFNELSQKAKDKIKRLAFPRGAELWCAHCDRRNKKTPEEMEKYLSKWPRCCGIPAQVKPL